MRSRSKFENAERQVPSNVAQTTLVFEVGNPILQWRGRCWYLITLRVSPRAMPCFKWEM